VQCSVQSLSDASCLPGVYVVKYSFPKVLLPPAVVELPSSLYIAIEVAEAAFFSVNLDFPAPSMAAAEDLAASLESDLNFQLNLSAAATEEAMNTVNNLNTSGRVLGINSQDIVIYPADASPTIVVKVNVAFLYVPGFDSYVSAWPDGVWNWTVPIDDNVLSLRRGRLLQRDVVFQRSRKLLQGNLSGMASVLQGTVLCHSILQGLGAAHAEAHSCFCRLVKQYHGHCKLHCRGGFHLKRHKWDNGSTHSISHNSCINDSSSHSNDYAASRDFRGASTCRQWPHSGITRLDRGFG
jgi:hypothetical protein